MAAIAFEILLSCCLCNIGENVTGTRMMEQRYYPVNLDVKDKTCLVVGGGQVGERKVKTLLDCGAHVVVISPETTEGLRALASNGRIDLALRSYKSSDLEGGVLVIGATNDEKTNRKISRDATQRGILCNIADRPDACSFVLPAIVRQGHLIIAISTSNQSPAVAKRIRQTLDKEFGPEYAELLKLMGAIRKKLLAEGKSPEANKKEFERLLDLGLLEMIRDERIEDVDATLSDVMGKAYTRDTLMQHDDGLKSG
jgi:precorrin-2 dehydrogenase/sirohydrochlorin ferrochelatase